MHTNGGGRPDDQEGKGMSEVELGEGSVRRRVLAVLSGSLTNEEPSCFCWFLFPLCRHSTSVLVCRVPPARQALAVPTGDLVTEFVNHLAHWASPHRMAPTLTPTGE